MLLLLVSIVTSRDFPSCWSIVRWDFDSKLIWGISVFFSLFIIPDFIWEMNRGQRPEPLDFFIWTVEDVGLWLEEISLGSYREIFRENGVNGEYLENMSIFTTEQILRFIRRCHMKWGDFITLCKELRRIKVACLKGEQKVRRPWWAPSCLSVVFMKVAKRNRQSRVVSLKLENLDA
ncbi:hypothetical protein SAY87_001435 [Trapa incisa]|uniref:SAM domain-containing protein n=2 Tax=Trapa TaxID=22665 RepID=A0AAN7GKG1_9MYRT|nr:hypothetical protein SAY87_001435 [Trapa incisa]